MDWIAQEITSVDVVDVNVVSIEPPDGPRVKHVEPKAAVLKTSRPALEVGTVYVKPVLTAETGTETVVRNAPVTSRGLCVVGLLLLLRRPGLLLVLSLSRLLCRPSLLLLLLRLLLLLVSSLRVRGSNCCREQEQNCCT